MPESKTQHDIITKAHTSLWVGLWVPLETAKKLALSTEVAQTAEQPEALHLTLAMCGDVATLGAEATKNALDAIKVYAKGAAPIDGSISGIGRFTGGDKDVIYASFDSPGLTEFRQGLVEALEHVGVPTLANHGFTPHITLAYVDKGWGANLFPLGNVPDPIPMYFDSVRVGVAEVYHEFPLEGRAVQKTQIIVTKADGDRNIVFGWANVSIRQDGTQIEDHQKDLVDPEDLETAAYQFNLDFRETGVMHEGEAVGYLIESFMVTPEKLEKMGLAPDALPIGWWVGFYIPDDAVFAKVKSGEFKMFSIQGRAIREEVTT